MLIQIHMLQNYAPSNLNRDQSGAPKDAMFGGRRRGRISSQCQKRAIRHSSIFSDAFRDDGLLGTRTQQLPTLIEEQLKSLKATKEEITAIIARVPEIGRESSKRKNEADSEEADTDEEGGKTESEQGGETKQLIFLDRQHELPDLAAQLLKLCRSHGAKLFADSKKLKIDKITSYLRAAKPRSVDIALFGRMTTSDAFDDVQAACQVAHALSTHAVEQEFDYYTALDDLKPLNEPGADMIGDIEFNSCTYYKYANVHWETLTANLGEPADSELAARVVTALIRAAILVHPTGKQNSFAAFNVPDFVLVEITDKNVPLNYANAFVKPVRPNENDSLVDASIKALNKYVAKVDAVFSHQPARFWLNTSDNAFQANTAPKQDKGEGEQPSLAALESAVLNRILRK